MDVDVVVSVVIAHVVVGESNMAFSAHCPLVESVLNRWLEFPTLGLVQAPLDMGISLPWLRPLRECCKDGRLRCL